MHILSWKHWVLGLCCLGLGACSGDDDRPPPLESIPGNAPPIPWERLPEVSALFEEGTCRKKVPGYAIQCGMVTVPELPGSSRTLSVEVVRIFSKATNPEPDPIVYLEGGPGFPGSAAVLDAFTAFEPFLERRDLVVIDQRGTGRSGDSLFCDELTSVATDEEIVDGLTECFARLDGEGINLSAYTTAPSAADVDMVRQALGYDQWNLLGISYGTRLALTVLRDHPGGVRSVVIDAVVPLQADLIANLAANGVGALEEAFAACARQSSCSERYPNPMEQLLRVVTALNENPREVRSSRVTGDQVVELLFQLMYVPEGVALVPWLINELEQEESDSAAAILDLIGGAADGGQTGMHLSVQCAEEVAFTSREEAFAAEEGLPEELVPGLTGRYYFDYCDAWPVPAAHAKENEPVRSSVPALVLSGGFDPITPPAYAELAHQDLDNSIHVNFAHLSHGVSVNPCGHELLAQFYDAPGEPLRQTCVAAIPQPDFQSVTNGAERRSVTVSGPEVSFTTSAPSEEQLDTLAQKLERHRRILGR